MNKADFRREENASFWRALPLAVLAWVFSLWLVGHVLMGSKVKEVPPRAVDARIVELPPTPPAPKPAPPAPAAPPPPPSPVQAQPKLIAPPPAAPAAKAAEPEPATPKTPPPPAVPPKPASPMAAPIMANNGPVGVANHGASLSSSDAPELPDDLLEAAAGMTVQAEFKIAADGSFTVNVILPPGMPIRALKIIQDELRALHATPAVQSGKAVAQTLTLRYQY